MPPPRLAFIGDPQAVSPWLLHSLGKMCILDSICHGEADRAISRFHARWAFDDPTAMLEETEPDGVVLACPVADRVRLSKQCLTAGAGVLVPGSPGRATACRRLGLFARLAGRFVLAAPALRFSPGVLMAKRLIESGKFGAPIAITLHSARRGGPGALSPDGDLIAVDQVFEAVDLIQHLVGPIGRVYAVSHDEGALAVTASAGGGAAVSMVFLARSGVDRVGLKLELDAGDGSRLRIDRAGGLLCGNGSKISAYHQVAIAAAEPAIELGYDGLTAEFRRRLEERRPDGGLIGPVPAVSAATEAILASAERGRPVMPKAPGLPKR